MSKVKITERLPCIIKEIDLEYPLYLYFQDTDEFLEEHVKVEENHAVIVKSEYFSCSITRQDHYEVLEHNIKHNLGDKKWFDEFYQDTLNFINGK